MTADDFRRLALALPDTDERTHHGKPDFRVRGKVFGSLEPAAGRGTVKLTADEQELLMGAEPDVFTPAAGAWGRQGWTRINLPAVGEPTLRDALHRAWRNTAGSPPRTPKR
jgi:hypothetical protein